MTVPTNGDIGRLWDNARVSHDVPRYGDLLPDVRATALHFARRARSLFGVSEKKARVLERIAYRLGWLDSDSSISEERMKRTRDVRYALLEQPPAARPVVELSTGAVYWRVGDTWQGTVKVPGVGASGEMAAFGPPTCVTADDFAKCAELLKDAER